MNRVPLAAEWIGQEDGHLRLLDQTRLPNELMFRDCLTVEDVWQAIKELAVRGAPVIGVAAAYGMVLAARQSMDLQKAAIYLKSSRPTAVNLAWAVDRMLYVTIANNLITRLLNEAHSIRNEDAAMCRAIGEHGSEVMPNAGGVLTHCNAVSLVASEYGTALAVVFKAWENSKRFHMFVDETRPLLQGARLTTWELKQRGIDHTLICDNMAGMLMKAGRIQAVIVGADRIAANGDTANKIGTYSLAVLAKHHGIPFYVAAPSSTFDLSLSEGSQIPIEERDPTEITAGLGRTIAPDGTSVFNPAFDVTPHTLITAIITDRAIIQPVSAESIRAHFSS